MAIQIMAILAKFEAFLKNVIQKKTHKNVQKQFLKPCISPKTSTSHNLPQKGTPQKFTL